MVLLLQHTLIYYILILLHIQSTLSSPTPRHRAPRNIAARPNAGGRFGATSDRGRDRHREKKPKAPPPAPVLKADAPPPSSAEALAGSAAQKNYDSAVGESGKTSTWTEML